MTVLPRIVITGFGVVSPIGSDTNEIIQALREGKSGIVPINLDDRLEILMGRVPEMAYPNRQKDMSVEFSLDATRKAIQTSGVDLSAIDPCRVTTVVSSSKGRLASLLASTSNPHKDINPNEFACNIIGQTIARTWRFQGAILNYAAACATGIHSLIRAAQALQHDEADLALAGSAESSGTALLMAGFKNMGALSLQPLRPFHRDRSGFNPGEGAAVFMLEREADAVARGAQILARLSGWDQRSDAHHITSAEDSGETIAYAMRRSLQMAGWSPADVEYINAHGTGTQLNDVIEGRAITKVFGTQTPPVSSLKPYIGHLLGASSAVEIALILASLQNDYIPPTLGLNDPDPDIPLHFVSETGTNRHLHRIMKLSLGFGGHIGIMALELP